MDESMVTRVAKAIYVARLGPDAGPRTVNEQWPSCISEARAAISATRQPLPMDAEVWSCPCCGHLVDRATIALAETKEESHG